MGAVNAAAPTASRPHARDLTARRHSARLARGAMSARPGPSASRASPSPPPAAGEATPLSGQPTGDRRPPARAGRSASWPAVTSTSPTRARPTIPSPTWCSSRSTVRCTRSLRATATSRGPTSPTGSRSSQTTSGRSRSSSSPAYGTPRPWTGRQPPWTSSTPWSGPSANACPWVRHHLLRRHRRRTGGAHEGHPGHRRHRDARRPDAGDPPEAPGRQHGGVRTRAADHRAGAGGVRAAVRREVAVGETPSTSRSPGPT